MNLDNLKDAFERLVKLKAFRVVCKRDSTTITYMDSPSETTNVLMGILKSLDLQEFFRFNLLLNNISEFTLTKGQLPDKNIPVLEIQFGNTRFYPYIAV